MNAIEINQRLETARIRLPYVEPVKRMIDRAEELDDARASIHNVLFEGNIKERLRNIRKVNSGWRGVNTAREITEKANSGEEAIRGLTDYGVIEEIEKDDPILARMIRNIKIDSREIQLLIDLKMMLEYKDRTKAVEMLSQPQRFAYIERQLKLFKDERLANELLNSLAYIQRITKENNGRIGFIMKFLTSMRSGVKEDGTPLAYKDYVAAIEGFVAELKTKYSENRLANDIQRSDMIKQFVYYRSVILFLEKLLGMIHKGMYENDWGDFEVFYKGLKNEENVLNKFGDKRTSDELRAEKRAVHEYPREWGKKVKEILDYKNSPGAFEAVRKGAIRHLLILLGERISELSNEFNKKTDAALIELDNHVNKRLKGIRNMKNTAMNIIQLREKNLWGELQDTKREFSVREEQLLPHMQILKKVKGVLDGQDIEGIGYRTQALIKSKKQWLLYTYKNVSKARRGGANKQDFIFLNSALFAIGILENLANRSLETDTQTVNAVELMNNILQQTGPILGDYIKRLETIINFLQQKKFVLKPEAETKIVEKVKEEMDNG